MLPKLFYIDVFLSLSYLRNMKAKEMKQRDQNHPRKTVVELCLDLRLLDSIPA